MNKSGAFKRIFLALLLLVLAACSSNGDQSTVDLTAETASTATAVAPTQTPEPTDPPPTAEPEPTETAASPTETPPPTAAEPAVTIDYQPLFPIGSTADWTATSDAVGIEGTAEFISATQIRISDFVFLAAEAPGVDIRLGLDRNFEDDVAVSLKDITGDTYEGGSLTLTVPDEAFDGREFNSIGVVCYDNGDVFDWAIIQPLAPE